MGSWPLIHSEPLSWSHDTNVSPWYEQQMFWKTSSSLSCTPPMEEVCSEVTLWLWSHRAGVLILAPLSVEWLCKGYFLCLCFLLCKMRVTIVVSIKWLYAYKWPGIHDACHMARTQEILTTMSQVSLLDALDSFLALSQLYQLLM